MDETGKLVLGGIVGIFVIWWFTRKHVSKRTLWEIILIGIVAFLSCREWANFSGRQAFGLAWWLSVAVFYCKSRFPFGK
jgi:hypothetical protein